MNRRRILLVVAVVIAVFGVGLVFLYAQHAKDDGQTDAASTPVLVATQEIPAGMSAADAATAGRIVSTAVPSDAVIPGATDDGTVFKSEVALTNIYPGEQLISQKFGSSDKVEVIARLPVPEGEVAIPISLDQIASVGDFTQPGSSVCMYLTGTFPPNNVSATRVLLAKVAILAVGSDIIGTDQPTAGTLPSSLFTLALSPHDALVVKQAQGAGTLSLGLLGPGQTVTVGDQVSQNELFSTGPGNK